MSNNPYELSHSEVVEIMSSIEIFKKSTEDLKESVKDIGKLYGKIDALQLEMVKSSNELLEQSREENRKQQEIIDLLIIRVDELEKFKNTIVKVLGVIGTSWLGTMAASLYQFFKNN